MVISAETAPAPPPEPLVTSAATFAPSSQSGSLQSSLHNFDFPVLKTWGRHRVLRCLNVNRKGEVIAGEGRSGLVESYVGFSERIRRNDDRARVEEAGFEQVKAKLLVHFREAADRINKVAVPNSKLSAPAPFATTTAVLEPSSYSHRDVIRPWNLRTRRVPISKEPRSSGSPPHPASEKSGQSRAVRLRSEGLEKHEWPKISIPLSREQIEEDIYTLTGSRPRRRPQKRPRTLQRQLDVLLPGSWLPSISLDAYRVPDDVP